MFDNSDASGSTKPQNSREFLTKFKKIAKFTRVRQPVHEIYENYSKDHMQVPNENYTN